MSKSHRDGSYTTASGGRTAPGPRGGFILGSVRDFRQDQLGFMLEMARRYGDVARYRIANMYWHQINHPEGIRRVLQQNNRNYGKGKLTRSALGPLLGEGLIISEGDTWLRQRRLMQPVFHRRRVDAFGELMTDKTLEMLDRWVPEIESGKPVDVAAEMARLTLDIATEALFSSHVGEEPETIARAVTTLVEDVSFRFKAPLYPPRSVPTPRNRSVRAALRTLDGAVYRIIEERRHAGSGDDLLALLLEARDEETGEAMSDRQLRDEVLTLFLAGHETTATALTWTFYLLATHPAAEQRMREELESSGMSGTPAVVDLPRLQYARRVIDEAIRLYPPAWVTNRQVLADDEILGCSVRAGDYVILSPYVLHRNPDFWVRPEEFDPDRFLSELRAGRPRFAYFPFGGGPRQCIGQSMALVEAHLILGTVAARYRLRLASDEPVKVQALATLRPQHGLPMTVEPA